ncbi:MAG: lysine 2,3-aminomutase [Bacteroidales bacterium]|nr:lysine 2,3-aminomutase [Bacteroidales bacterium]
MGDKVHKYKAYTLRNFLQIKQLTKLSRTESRDIEVAGNILPFRVNNYVIDELIDWDHYDDDPIFNLTFPRKEMLTPEHFRMMDSALKDKKDPEQIKLTKQKIYNQLNPHPAGQLDLNVPEINGQKLHGVQHKYRETVLFFPSAGQTCHSYCTFCFRWAQFIGIEKLKFATQDSELLAEYIQKHNSITDVLFTGGDPMVMNYKTFEKYIDPLIKIYKTCGLQTIRIGTKSLSYWPYKYTSDEQADDFIRIFEKIVKTGINLAIMAHFSHPRELETNAVDQAIRRIRSTGAQIRTQSPILRHINDKPEIWSAMWRKQVNLNCIPYYMFIARDTGAKHYFELPLVKAWEIYRHAYQNVSGVCRTVRGPSMSCTPGKVQILGVSETGHEKVMVLRFIQGRNPDWVAKPFFARYNPEATWMSELKPAYGDKFFFEEELESLYKHKTVDSELFNFE